MQCWPFSRQRTTQLCSAQQCDRRINWHLVGAMTVSEVTTWISRPRHGARGHGRDGHLPSPGKCTTLLQQVGSQKKNHNRCHKTCSTDSKHGSRIKEVKVKERIVLREIHLRTTGRHLSMGSHSVIPTEVTAPPSPQPGRLVLDLSTP